LIGWIETNFDKFVEEEIGGEGEGDKFEKSIKSYSVKMPSYILWNLQ
jgi:hypothetical protein